MNRTFLSYFSDSIASKGISYSEGIILVNIGYTPGISQDKLAHDLVIDKAAVARSVKSLNGKRHVRTERSRSDRRQNKLSLTESGEVLFRYIRGLNHTWVDYVTSDIREKDLPRIFETIEKMVVKAKGFAG